MLSVKHDGIKYHFWVFGMTRPGIELRSPGPLANTKTYNVIYILSCTSGMFRASFLRQFSELVTFFDSILVNA